LTFDIGYDDSTDPVGNINLEEMSDSFPDFLTATTDGSYQLIFTFDPTDCNEAETFTIEFTAIDSGDSDESVSCSF